MTIELSALECRVLGCLIEKQVTTPSNIAVAECTAERLQSKEQPRPVMELAESQVQAVVDALIKRHLILERSGFGSRVPSISNGCAIPNQLAAASDRERAVLCELLLRGRRPQVSCAPARAHDGFRRCHRGRKHPRALRQRASGALVHRLP